MGATGVIAGRAAPQVGDNFTADRFQPFPTSFKNGGFQESVLETVRSRGVPTAFYLLVYYNRITWLCQGQTAWRWLSRLCAIDTARRGCRLAFRAVCIYHNRGGLVWTKFPAFSPTVVSLASENEVRAWEWGKRAEGERWDSSIRAEQTLTWNRAKSQK